jgi:hypothetical protein
MIYFHSVLFVSLVIDYLSGIQSKHLALIYEYFHQLMETRTELTVVMSKHLSYCSCF